MHISIQVGEEFYEYKVRLSKENLRVENYGHMSYDQVTTDLKRDILQIFGLYVQIYEEFLSRLYSDYQNYLEEILTDWRRKYQNSIVEVGVLS